MKIGEKEKSILIDTQPSGAEIFVAEEFIGHAPVELDVTYDLILEDPKAPVRQIMCWGPFLPITLLVALVKFPDSRSATYMRPYFIWIFKPSAFTSSETRKLYNKGKKIFIESRKEGFELLTREIDTYQDSRIELGLSGTTKKMICIHSLPPGASIYLDNECIGRTPLERMINLTYDMGELLKQNLKVALDGFSPAPSREYITDKRDNYRFILEESQY